MRPIAPPAVLTLARGQILRWNRREPVRLRVGAGRVWVTQALDPDDHFLDAGATLRLAPRAQVLIGAEGEGAWIVLERIPAESNVLRGGAASLTSAGRSG